jgi:hypothetical protein
MLQEELTPFIKFDHSTANQTILEAIVDSPDIHVVDLNVGEGVTYIRSRSQRQQNIPPHGGYGGYCMTARWPSEFAESMNLPRGIFGRTFFFWETMSVMRNCA